MSGINRKRDRREGERDANGKTDVRGSRDTGEYWIYSVHTPMTAVDDVM